MRAARVVEPPSVPDAAHLALPDEEIRRLVLRITADGDVAPLVRRMVRFIDGLKKGGGVVITRPGPAAESAELLRLCSALARAVEDGRLMAAYLTAFLAAHYAYQNSLDYLCTLVAYMDGFRGEPRRAAS